MTRTIQLLMIINLVQIIPKADDKNHPIFDDYKFGTGQNWMNRTIQFWNLIVDFRHYTGKLAISIQNWKDISQSKKNPKVDENRSTISFHFWKRNIPLCQSKGEIL